MKLFIYSLILLHLFYFYWQNNRIWYGYIKQKTLIISNSPTKLISAMFVRVKLHCTDSYALNLNRVYRTTWCTPIHVYIDSASVCKCTVHVHNCTVSPTHSLHSTAIANKYLISCDLCSLFSFSRDRGIILNFHLDLCEIVCFIF